MAGHEHDAIGARGIGPSEMERGRAIRVAVAEDTVVRGKSFFLRGASPRVQLFIVHVAVPRFEVVFVSRFKDA